MTITKEKLHHHINLLPEDITIDEVIERLIMLEKIETRLEESAELDTIDESSLKEEMQEWFE